MIRSLSLAAAAALVVMSGSLAHAAQAQEAQLSYKPSLAATAEGRQELKRKIAAAAETFCRVNLIEGTVSACRRDTIETLSRQVDERVAQVAASQTATQIASGQDTRQLFAQNRERRQPTQR